MKTKGIRHIYKKFCLRKKYFPFSGHIELTYSCSLNCIHCYCKGWEIKRENAELSTDGFKQILDEIQKEGCIYLTLSGGDPLIRDDFLEIYSYAKKKGFVITIFTSGQEFRKEIIDFLVKSPPFSIEITLNGITKDTYESITGIKGSYKKAMEAIRLLAKKKLPLILKTNCLKQNKNEVAKVKAFTESLLGKPSSNRHRFKYDSFIEPRLNGDTSVCSFRLSYEELLKVRRQDRDMWKEFEESLHKNCPDLRRERNFLYQCSSWMDSFFINPYGRLKFCIWSDKFSVDLKTRSFREGFYNVFPKILEQKFKTNSKCRDCSLRALCQNCPARAYLETGDEEAPVEYYCDKAKKMAKLWQLYQGLGIAGQPSP